MIFACERVRDVDRASQWCDHFMEFCSRNDLRAHLAFCRGHYASVLTARGRWDEAEDQLAQALEGLRCRIAWSLSTAGTAGRAAALSGSAREEAEEILRAGPAPSHRHPRQGQGGPGPGRARDGAGSGRENAPAPLGARPSRADRRAGAPGPDPLRPWGGRDADEALQELEAIAGIVRTDCLLALVSHARGQVALVAGDAAQAKAHLEDALDLYERNRLPFDAALARLDLGRALHALGRRDPALDQARTARDTLREPGSAAAKAGPGRRVRRDGWRDRSSARAKRRCSSC